MLEIRHRTQRRLPGRRAVTLPVQRQRRRRASDVRGRDAGVRACVREHVAVNVRPVRRWWPWRVSRLASVVKSTVGRGDGGSSRPWPRRSPCTPALDASTRREHRAHRSPASTVTVRVTAALLRSPSLITNDTARSAVVCVPVGSSDVLEYVTARSAVCQAQRASRHCRSATASPLGRVVRGRDAGMPSLRVREHVAVNVRPAVMVAVARVEVGVGREVDSRTR